MPLIIGLLTYFAGGFAAGLVYHLAVKRRPFWRALHLAAIFGLAVMIVVAVLAVALDILNITPEPTAG